MTIMCSSFGVKIFSPSTADLLNHMRHIKKNLVTCRDKNIIIALDT